MSFKNPTFFKDSMAKNQRIKALLQFILKHYYNSYQQIKEHEEQIIKEHEINKICQSQKLCQKMCDCEEQNTKEYKINKYQNFYFKFKYKKVGDMQNKRECQINKQ
ncbi:hypothetical protein ABPG74_017241 [Tetrahymena malaccensis]